MIGHGRVLVTTALEETWPDEGPVLFLGEWCRLFSRRHVWEGLDAEVAPYHWDDREKLHRDHAFLAEEYTYWIAELATVLNAAHGTAYGVRFWKIQAGPWLRSFIEIVFDRWTMLENAVAQGAVGPVRAVGAGWGAHAPVDSADYYDRLGTDVWNSALYGRILEAMGGLEVQAVPAPSRSPEAPSLRTVVRWGYRRMTNTLGGLRSSPDDAVMLGARLPNRPELERRTGRPLPSWQPLDSPSVAVDPDRRAALIDPTREDAPFRRVVAAVLGDQLPTVYLEGFQALTARALSIPFPARPKSVVITDIHSHDTWKRWVAEKVEGGSRLGVWQHGALYCTARVSSAEAHERDVSDHVLVWGESDPSRGELFVGPCVPRLSAPRPTADRLALVTVAFPRYSHRLASTPVASQGARLIDLNLEFLAALDEPIRHATTVRLYGQDNGWDQERHYRAAFPDVAVDNGLTGITDLLQDSRLIVCAYNSTLLLECFDSERPVIAFWDPELWELRDEAEEAFEALVGAGILFFDGAGAAAGVRTAWADPEAWWASPRVAEARQGFAEAFVRRDANGLDNLAAWLRQDGPSGPRQG